jgi:hypothetical protein
MRHLLPLLLICIVAGTASAQHSKQDYLITVKGDTLHGRLHLTGKRNNNIRFHRPGMGHSDFGPAETKQYGTAKGIVRVSRMVGAEGKMQFMTPLVEGYANLYSGENEQNENRYYLQSPGSTYVTEIGPKSTQLTLARTLPGCAALDFVTDEIQRQYPYSTDGLARLVMAYNACQQPSKSSLRFKRVGTGNISVGLKGGINLTTFTLNAPAFEGFGPQRDTKGYQAGLALNFSSRTPFSAQIEANYIALSGALGPYEAYRANKGIPSNTHNTRIDYTQLQVPFLLRYTIGFGTLRPFINAGPSISLLLKNASVDTYPSSTSAGLVTEEVGLGKTALGLAAGGGISIHTAVLPVVTLEIRYDRVSENIAKSKFLLHLERHDAVRLEAGIFF